MKSQNLLFWVLIFATAVITACNNCPPNLEYKDFTQIKMVVDTPYILRTDTFHFHFEPERLTYLAQHEPSHEWSLFPQAQAAAGKLCPEEGNSGYKYTVSDIRFTAAFGKPYYFFDQSHAIGDTLNPLIEIGVPDPLTKQLTFQPYDNLFVATGNIFDYTFRIKKRPTDTLIVFKAYLTKSNNQTLIAISDSVRWER